MHYVSYKCYHNLKKYFQNLGLNFKKFSQKYQTLPNFFGLGFGVNQYLCLYHKNLKFSNLKKKYMNSEDSNLSPHFSWCSEKFSIFQMNFSLKNFKKINSKLLYVVVFNLVVQTFSFFIDIIAGC